MSGCSKRISVVCAGNMTIDDVILPDGTQVRDQTGGDAIFAGLAARLVCDDVGVVAPVGADLPPSVVSELTRMDFDQAGLVTRSLPTLRATVRYHDADERDWSFSFNDADYFELSPQPDDFPAFYRDAKAFMILAMSLKAQEQLTEWLPRFGNVVVGLDPQQEAIIDKHDRWRKLISRVGLFMPSAVEVTRLLGHSDYARAARQLAELGPRVVVIKLGAQGCLAYDASSGSLVRCPAWPSDVIDTTGAGDSFCGAFLAAYSLGGGDLAGPAAAGIAAASFTIEAFGNAGLRRATRGRFQERYEETLRRITKEKGAIDVQ